MVNGDIYHDLCWVKAKRDVEVETIAIENFAKTLSDIEHLFSNFSFSGLDFYAIWLCICRKN